MGRFPLQSPLLECPKCKGRMKILVAVVAPASARRVLVSLGPPCW
jgi:hypothetical protein